MLDSHCHLTDGRLSGQLAEVLARAEELGITGMITIGTDLADAARAIELCQRAPDLQRANDTPSAISPRNAISLRCAIGVHPNHAAEIELSDLPRLESLQNDPAVVALGEMGLDYFHAFAPREKQRLVFEFQLDLAARLNRPVVIHSREAIDDTLAIMRGFPNVRGVFHCFTGNSDEAGRILDQGYFLGFTGPITYKKNEALREVVRLTPDDRLLVETDSPYLTPEPMRKQKTNEPGFVRYVAERVAQIKRWTLEETDAVTTRNAGRLFGWPQAAAETR